MTRRCQVTPPGLSSAGGRPVNGSQSCKITRWASPHPGGGLAFGPDGALYVSGGEGAIATVVDYGQRSSVCNNPPGEGRPGSRLRFSGKDADTAQDSVSSGVAEVLAAQRASGSVVPLSCPDSGDMPSPAGTAVRALARLVPDPLLTRAASYPGPSRCA